MDHFKEKVELMNGCTAKAHSNLFISSTLTGPNKGEKGLDEKKIQENIEAALDVYISHVSSALYFGTTLSLKKGSKNDQLIKSRVDV